MQLYFLDAIASCDSPVDNSCSERNKQRGADATMTSSEPLAGLLLMLEPAAGPCRRCAAQKAVIELRAGLCSACYLRASLAAFRAVEALAIQIRNKQEQQQ